MTARELAEALREFSLDDAPRQQTTLHNVLAYLDAAASREEKPGKTRARCGCEMLYRFNSGDPAWFVSERCDFHRTASREESLPPDAEALAELREWAEAGVCGRVILSKGDGGARRAMSTLSSLNELERLRAGRDRALKVITGLALNAGAFAESKTADVLARVKEALEK